MKKLYLFAAAAVLLTATPAAANGGYAGVEYGNTDLDSLGGEIDIWQGEGAYGWNNGNWGAQIGGQLGTGEFNTGGDADFYGLDGHIYFQGSTWRLGGVIVHNSLDTGGGGDLDETGYGVEGTLDVAPNFDLIGSYTIGETDFLGGDFDMWHLDAGANYYFTPNMRVGAVAGLGNIDGGGGDADTSTIGVNGEFQPWAAPVSITLAWNQYDIDDSGFDSNSFRIGARWNFGGGTLQERNDATPFTAPVGVSGRLFGTY